MNDPMILSVIITSAPCDQASLLYMYVATADHLEELDQAIADPLAFLTVRTKLSFINGVRDVSLLNTATMSSQNPRLVYSG
jgi:hypothetical protein